MPPKGGHPLSPKKRKLVNAKLANPLATQTELAGLTGYAGKQGVSRALKDENVRAEIKRVMLLDEKLRIPALLSKLREGLDAVDTRCFAQEVTIGHEPALDSDGNEIKDAKGKTKMFPVKDLKVKTVDVVDYSVRHKYLESALDLHGAKSRNGEDSGGGFMAVLFGQASEEQKESISSIMIALRISRGLHPLESRPLTAEEVERYK